MANVTTTPTVVDHLAPPGNASIAIRTDRVYFAVVRTSADQLNLYRSTDQGASWTNYSSFTHAGLQEWSSLVIDPFGWAHIAYRVGTASFDTIWYRRIDTSGNAATGTWGTALQASNNDANGGVIGSTWQGLDMAVVRHNAGTYAIVIAGARNTGTSKHGVMALGVSITREGLIYSNNAIITGNRLWQVTGTPPGRSGVQVEAQHSGIAWEPSSTPHIWIIWGRSSLRMVRLVWINSTTGWQGPTNPITVRSSLPYPNDFIAARWDGKQHNTPVISPDDPTKIRVYVRNQSNTNTSPLIDTPAHPTGNVRYIGLSYDNRTYDPRVYAVGTSTNVLYYCDYSRSAAIWSAWATVVAGAVSNVGAEFSTNRGGIYQNARYNVLTGHNTVSPYTITHTMQTINTPPGVPTWDLSSAPWQNGGAADVGAALPLVWTFTDVDPGQSQSSYALSRTIGVGATSYWNASNSTWGVTEVQNSSATTGVTLPSGWGADADAAHTYRVKVWDTANTPSAGYSVPLQLTPSAKVNPTMTAPTGGGTVSQDTVTVTWTVAAQSAYQVRLTNVSTGLVVHDSGRIAGTELTYTVPVSLTSGTQYTATLWTYNLEGLASNGVSATFTSTYAPPVAAIAVPVASTADGWIAVGTSGPAAAGLQPVTTDQDLYRRPKTAAVLNGSISAFPGNVTGWVATSGSVAYSTTQFISGPGSARFTPSGASADARMRMNAPVDAAADITAGRSFEAAGWLRPDTANKPMFIRVDFYDAASSLVGNYSQTFTSVTAGAWHHLSTTANPLALGFTTATKVAVSIGLLSTPAVGDAYYADDVTIRLANTDDGVRVASLIAPGGTYYDWSAAALTDYEYRWQVRGANGGTQTGPWTG